MVQVSLRTHFTTFCENIFGKSEYLHPELVCNINLKTNVHFVKPYLGKCTETGETADICTARDQMFRYTFLNKVVLCAQVCSVV